uniref:Nucleotidyl transferase domain-containing protein n=1 Tax=Caldiarchaeum subterraneum TaxID=311458 RepID=A0A7C5LAA0_CALS0
MDSGLKAVVLAAGYGKRLMPLTANRPKHVLPIAGKPLINHTLEALAKAGADEIGVLLGYRSEEIVEALKKFDGARLEYIYQEEIAGTGAALRECRGFLAGEEHFLVVYGDLTVTAEVVLELVDFFRRNMLDGVLAAVEVEETGPYGVVETRDGLLARIGEKESRRGPINAGIYILGGEVFDELEKTRPSIRGEIELTDALNNLAAKGRRLGVKMFGKGWWFDIGRPADYLAANHTYIRRLLGEGMMVGPRVYLGNNVSLKGPLVIAEGVTIEDDCIVEGPAMVCERVRIAADSVVKASLILEDCYIGPSSKLQNSIICEKTVFENGVEVVGGGFPAFVSPPSTTVSKRLKVP